MKSSSRAIGQRLIGFGVGNFELARLRLVGEIGGASALAGAFAV
jgi:hypothetical protein